MFAFCVTAHESIPMYTYFSKNVSMYLQIYTLKYILKLTYYIKDSCFKKKKKYTTSCTNDQCYNSDTLV